MNFGKHGNLAPVQTVNPQELYQAIVDASSQDPSRVHSSSARLDQMLRMLGTIDALQEIAIQRSLPLPIRQQAAIQFKNSVSASWRSRRILSDEHRMRIRARTLGLLDEADDAISQCNKTAIATIARLDFPHTWPDLFDNLLVTIDVRLTSRYSAGHDEQQDALILFRCLEILNTLLKQFATIKRPNGVQLMANIVQTFRDRLFSYFGTLALTLSATLNLSAILTERLLQDIMITHLLYKSLVKIAVWSWQWLNKYSKEEAAAANTWQAQLFTFSYDFTQKLFSLRKDIVIALTRDGKITQAHKPLRALTKHVRTCGKYFRRLQQLDASRFVELPQCGDLVLYHWKQVVDATDNSLELIADTDEAVYPTQILVQGMVLFKESLSQWAPIRRDGTENPNTLTQEFVQNAAQLLITRFIPLNSTDLESWSTDPEGWLIHQDKEDNQWEFEIRPCSERVLLILINNYSDYVVPLLCEIFKSAVTPAVDLNAVIQKEAIYCALGRCAHRLKKEIPFDQWLQHTLAVEAKEPANPSYPIIKRRIAWLIAKWVSEDCASPDNPLIWDVLVHLLGDRSPSTDTVVRLTAATALKDCIDIFGYSMNYLLPHLATTIRQLVQLLGEAETLESKRRVDTALNTMIEQAGHQIAPFVSMIVEPLPHLWSSAGDDWLFKASLLVTVTKLVEAIKEQSNTLGAVVVPLVQESFSNLLQEDGLNLWLSALRNTTTMSSVDGAPALSDLIPSALGLLADDKDVLGTTINIIESYIFLDAPGVIQIYGAFLFEALTRAIKSHALPTNLKSLTGLTCICIQLTPPTAWAPLLHSSGLFAWLLDKIVENETNTLVMTEFIYVFARIALADPQVFSQLISAAAGQLDQKESYLMEGLLDQWWSKFDNMSEPRHRKLTAMGIASFLSTGKTEILARLPSEIFNLWLDVFGEIKEAQNLSGSYADSDSSPPPLKHYWDVDEAPSWFYQNTEGTPEYERRKAVYDNDPVRMIQLNTFINEKLQEAERNSDPAFFKATVAKADPTVFEQIHAELVR